MAPRTRSRTLMVAIAVVVVVLAVGGGFLAQRNSEVPGGGPLAQELLNQAPVPPGSVATDSVIKSLNGPPSIEGCSPLWDLHRVFVVDSSTDVRSFVQSHLPKENRITGSGISGGPGVPTVTFFTVTIASNQGSKAPMLLYSSVTTGKRSTALRVDAQVVLPTSRCVTHGSDVDTTSRLSAPVLIGRNLTGESDPSPTPGSISQPPSCTSGEVVCPL